MKYVFFGTPRFAEIVLGGLIASGFVPAAIVCNPDRPLGRKKIVTPPPTKLLALKTSPDIDIIQPETLDEMFIKRLRALEPDFFVVAAYAKIIPASGARYPTPRHTRHASVAPARISRRITHPIGDPRRRNKNRLDHLCDGSKNGPRGDLCAGRGQLECVNDRLYGA